MTSSLDVVARIFCHVENTFLLLHNLICSQFTHSYKYISGVERTTRLNNVDKNIELHAI